MTEVDYSALDAPTISMNSFYPRQSWTPTPDGVQDYTIIVAVLAVAVVLPVPLAKVDLHIPPGPGPHLPHLKGRPGSPGRRLHRNDRDK